MSSDRSNRVVVVTGASSGIGAATARALAAEGHRLALLGRRGERLERLASELGNGAIAVAADVTERATLLAAAARVEVELGGADVLVNNAGVMLLAPFGADHGAEARRMVETNLLGALSATEVFLGQLRERRGDLVNVSSVAGRTARPGNAAYAATKWAMGGWSESLRQELQPQVRVILVEPGAVATELTDHIGHEATRQATREFYDQVAIAPEEIATVIAFAVSRPHDVSISEVLVRPTGQAL